MSARRLAVRVGVRRGWTEWVQSVRSPQDQAFYVVTSAMAVGYVYLRRNAEIEGSSISFPEFALPSILAAVVVFGLAVGPMYSLAMEREDGTLLRARAVPNGVTGYLTGQLLFHSLSLLPAVVILLVPSLILFDGLMQRGLAGWLTMVGVLVLGLAATLPIGMVIGSLVPNLQKVGTWGMFPVMAVAGISGVFFPIQTLWGWLQGVAQVFPMYWLALGMRSAFLPDHAAELELTESWRTLETVGVLSAWAVAGILVAPRVLRRMTSRQSGAAMAEAREAATQWVR